MDNNFVNWNDIFSGEGILIPGANEIIHSSRSLHVPQVQGPGASFVWHKKHMKKILMSDDISLKVSDYMKELNGTASEHEFSLIYLPKKHEHLQTFKKELGKLSREEQMESPLGKYVLESSREGRINFKFIVNLIQSIPFFHLVENCKGSVVFERVPTSYQTSGIYLFREYAPGDPCGTTVYVGMSIGCFLKTIKAHFYKRRDHPTYIHHHVRGEDRGKWIEKIAKGYRYSVGILPMKIDTHKSIFFDEVKLIETKFIHALYPRDNVQEKLYADEQHQLFDEAEIPGYVRDDEDELKDAPF
jgi:hypothetical protein